MQAVHTPQVGKNQFYKNQYFVYWLKENQKYPDITDQTHIAAFIHGGDEVLYTNHSSVHNSGEESANYQKEITNF
jgi:hypothetical protein